MYQSPVSLHLAKVTMKTETRNDVTTSVAAVNLVLEPLTRELARELSSEIADHCFTKDGGIRPEIANFTVRLAELQQYVTAKMAADVAVHATLRHVRCVSLSVSKRGPEPGEAEKKSKKVGPSSEVLRATLSVLVDPDSAEVREFLMRRFGNTFIFEFEDEDKQLDFSNSADDDEEDEDEDPAPRQPKLKPAPDPDPEAGDILEEQLIIRTLADMKIEVSPAKFRGYSSDEQAQLLAWAKSVEALNAKPGTTFEDLPAPPAFLFDLKSTRKKAATKLANVVLDAVESKTPRAPRRSSKNFKNAPRLAGKVTKATGRKGRAAR